MKYFVILPLLASCAGPYTPFGSKFAPTSLIEDTLKEKSSKQVLSIKNQVVDANIQYYPKHQSLHETKDFKVEIKDFGKITKDSTIVFLYNGMDITSSIKQVSSVSKNNDKITYKVKSLTLPASEDHRFVVLYKRGANTEIIAKEYPFPKCDFNNEVLFDESLVKTNKKIKENISNISKQNKINSALIAGLIAQESSFNPKAVSWAKAVGLTQVTPVAEKQIEDTVKDWNVYPNWQRMPASILKSHIRSGKMNRHNDWKLNPKTSIQGGVQYLKYLTYFWTRPQNKEAIPLELRKGEQYTSIILASYNSGPSRVKRRLLSHGKNWLKAKDLKEAKKYIGKVKSYCSNFTIE